MPDFQHPDRRCPHCGRQRHTPDIAAMIDDGTLRIAPDVSDGIAEQIVREYFAGRWPAKPYVSRDQLSRYAEIGQILVTAYEIGDAVFHILTDHAGSFFEIVQGD